jgi:glycosyltransferase involved in cell wall biosynthesis
MATANAPAAPLLLDISRLIWRTPRLGPSGIDRIEFEYARHFLAPGAARPAYGVINFFGWLIAISPAGAQRFLQDLAARWEGSHAQSLEGPHRTRGTPAPWAIYLRLVTSAWSGSFWLRHKLRGHGGVPVFLVVSHHHLSRDATVPRIRRAFGARCVCFLHDLIPIEYPEYFRAGWEERGWRISANAARHYDAVIVNSAATAAAFQRYLDARPENAIPPPVRVALPGIRAFAPPKPAVAPGATALPYFVVLGTIEPRKNHLLLLNLWARLGQRKDAGEEHPPLLHVIGARGWENEQVVDMLERCLELRGLVMEHNRLDDNAVAQLLCGARALLLPSFVEGFGLPLAEALASGVPVICSDIPVFREVGGDVPEYLDPLDHFAWKSAVLDYCSPGSQRRATQLQRLHHWHTPNWQDHFASVQQLLGDLRDIAPAAKSAC